MGLKPLCLERPAPKWVSDEETSYAEYLKPCDMGEHTFSVYVRSRGDVLAWAELAWQDDDDQWHSVISEQVRRVGSPLRLTCTLDLPQAATVRCRVLAGDGRGAAWFDRAQLERGTLAGGNNLLQNANFTALTDGELPEGWIAAEGSGESSVETDLSKENDQGEFVFSNFDYGEWIIRETQAPEGYNRMPDMPLTQPVLHLCEHPESLCVCENRSRRESNGGCQVHD